MFSHKYFKDIANKFLSQLLFESIFVLLLDKIVTKTNLALTVIGKTIIVIDFRLVGLYSFWLEQIKLCVNKNKLV